ncbi:hypothetical protein [Nonomuraea sp. AD125B]|uniref:hypothetical protein n=1 Tax=Nonomuraea sp. AD125B TaxID=3242897 RepID=UPI0035275789
MRLSRSGNTLIGASLHAAARKAKGLELTELEQLLVGAMGTVLAQEEIAEFGRIYQEETSPTTARELFPDTITGRPLTKGLSIEELVTDFPRIGAEIAAQPNASLVRLDELAPDAPLDTEEFVQALATHGGGITVVVGPQEQAPRGIDGADAIYVKLSFRDFWCKRRSSELGKDEIYWTSSAGSDAGFTKEYESPEFGSIVTGSHRNFAAHSYLFNGNVDKWLTCNIACWEADHSGSGWYSNLRKGLRDISAYCFKASEDLEDNTGEYEGSSAWFSLVGLVARLFDWLLGLVTNDDDLVKERSIGFTRSALKALSRRPGGYDFWDFNGGGGGHHQVNIKAEVTEPAVNTAIRSIVLSGSGWSEDIQMPGSTPGAPALASYDGKLYCVVRGLTNQSLYWNSFDGTQWSSYTQLGDGAASPSAPALAAYGGKLYCVFRDANGVLNSFQFDGSRWSFSPQHPPGSTSAPPALAAYDGQLYCVVRGHTNSALYLATFNGSQWTSFSKLPVEAVTSSAPALAVNGSRLYCVYRAFDSTLRYTWAPYGSSSPTPWCPIQSFPSGSTAAAPALAVMGGKVFCVVRGGNANTKMFFSVLTNGEWTPFNQIDARSAAAPALAFHDGKIYCVHRG